MKTKPRMGATFCTLRWDTVTARFACVGLSVEALEL